MAFDVAGAKKAGFSDQQIQQYIASKPQDTTPKRGGLSKWLPTALGVAGTLAAAPFTGGTSLLGTAAILGTGAALGGGLGEFGAQKLNKEKTDIGKIGKEALISGATGAIPIGGAGKAAKVAGEVALEQGAKTAIEQGVEKTAGKGLFSRLLGKGAKAGEDILAQTEGRATGAIIKGGERVTPKLEKTVGTYLESIGAKGTPKDKLIQVAMDKEATGASIGDLVTANNTPVTISDLTRITAPVQKAGITAKNVSTETTNLYREAIGKATDKQSLQTIKGQLDDELANFYKRVEAGSATKGEERVLKSYRDGINSVLQDIPGYAEANGRYQTALTAEKLLLKAPKAKNITVMGIDTGIGGKTTQKAKDFVGRTLKTGGDGLPPVLPNVMSKLNNMGLTGRTVAATAKQVGGRAFMGAPTPPEDQTGMPTDMTMPTDMSQPPVDQNEQFKSALQSAAYKALAAGDTKAFNEIVSNYKLLDSLAPATAKPLNSTAAQNVTDMQNGISTLQELSANIQSSGSNIPIVGGLLAKNPFDTKAQSLQASIATAKQIIGKALEGGVLRKEDEVKYAKILPTMNDTDAVAQYKINLIADNLQRKLALYQQNLGGGSGGTDLSGLTGATQ